MANPPPPNRMDISNETDYDILIKIQMLYTLPI